MIAVRATADPSVVTEDFRRGIVSRGCDGRGAYVILSCSHKIRVPTKRGDPTETHRWCAICSHKSPYR